MLNADKGKGVDVFFLLPRADGEGYVLILDERKRAASFTLSDKPMERTPSELLLWFLAIWRM
jgi:hypothetical protein